MAGGCHIITPIRRPDATAFADSCADTAGVAPAASRRRRPRVAVHAQYGQLGVPSGWRPCAVCHSELMQPSAASARRTKPASACEMSIVVWATLHSCIHAVVSETNVWRSPTQRLAHSRGQRLGVADQAKARGSNPLWHQAARRWVARPRCSTNSASISRLKAGMSPGCRLVTQLPSRTTSRSSQMPPALRMSSCSVG
jgi:hypothetical protein